MKESRNPHIIECPSKQCELCIEDSKVPPCMHVADGGPLEREIVVVDVKRNQVHIWKGSIPPSKPPMSTDGWISIYISAFDDILSYQNDILDVRIFGPYLLIYTSSKNQCKVKYYPSVKTRIEYDMLNNLLRQTWDTPSWTQLRLNLSERISKMVELIDETILDIIPEINPNTRVTFAQLVAHEKLVLGPIVPFILDDDVEEIYMDRPSENLYIDHGIFGRVETDVKFENCDVNNLITLLRKESNLHLDRRNPSLKCEVSFFEVPLRFSAAIEPLAADGMTLEIRKAKSQPFDIPQLLDNDTMPVEAAALLAMAINLRMNITITGSPGCGKTTLLNALDMTTPSTWRKIYIEDVIESRFLQGHHQIRVQVNPIDEKLQELNKTAEILKTLHRSPDYLILGEIQSAEHSQALFQAISAGLSCIQTCHADSASSLLTRWKHSQGISDTSIALMDLIITMERPIPGKSARFISHISEVQRECNKGIIEFAGLHTIYSRYNKEQNVSFSENGAFSFLSQRTRSNNLLDFYELLLGLFSESKSARYTDFDSLLHKLHSKLFIEHASIGA